MTPEEKARFREQIAAIPAAPGAPVSRCAHCGRDVEEKIDPDMGGNHHRWWVHVPGGYTPCNPQQGARSTKAEPAPPEGLRERIAAALREHYLSTNRDEADADGNLPCRCGWRDPGTMGNDEDDWDSHLAAALLPVVEAHTAEETARLRAELAATVEDLHRACEDGARMQADRDRLAAEVADRGQRIAEARRLLAEAEQQVAQVEANAAHNAAVFHDVSTDRDRLAAEVAELRQIVAAPVSAASGPEFGRALVGKVGELVDERRHYAIAAQAVGRVRAALAEGQANGWTGFRYHQAISAALDGTGEASC